MATAQYAPDIQRPVEAINIPERPETQAEAAQVLKILKGNAQYFGVLRIVTDRNPKGLEALDAMAKGSNGEGVSVEVKRFFHELTIASQDPDTYRKTTIEYRQATETKQTGRLDWMKGKVASGARRLGLVE